MKFLLVLPLLILSVSAYQEFPWSSLCPCGKIYIPICASDKKTYNNICEFECRALFLKKTSHMEIFVVKHGRCEEVFSLSLLSLSSALPQWSGFAEKDCACTSQYDPVCASDLRRYYNSCTYDCRLEYLRRNSIRMIDRVDCKLLPPTVMG